MSKKVSKENFTRNETTVTTKSITLEGTKTLRIESVKTTSTVTKKYNDKTKNWVQESKTIISEEKRSMSFELMEVTSKELKIFRNNGVPSFVLKTKGKLYYTTIHDSMDFLCADILGKHSKCSWLNRECSRLSAASDQNGGCAKVRNKSQCIEDYPWIEEGYETFNTINDVFFVLKCLCYKK